jgi:hypothetical protein
MNIDREKAADNLADILTGSYDCVRVWSAWHVGTMSQNDFWPIADDSDRLNELIDAVVSAEQPIEDDPVAWLIPTEPSADWPWEHGFCEGTEAMKVLGAFPVYKHSESELVKQLTDEIAELKQKLDAINETDNLRNDAGL